MKVHRQLAVFGALLAVNALLALLAYVLFPVGPWAPARQVPTELAGLSLWQLGLANAGIVLVLYGMLGLLGLWFARRLGLPGTFREGAGWRAWVLWPLLLGLAVGIFIFALDRFFASAGTWGGLEHPPFPLSVVASATAGIGEEILFRMFVLGLCAFLLNLVLKRWKATSAALWIANAVAALAFGAAHLPTLMLTLGVSSPGEIPALALAELFVLNGVVGLVAGERYLRQGLIAAVGIHFWADVAWHVVLPLL